MLTHFHDVGVGIYIKHKIGAIKCYWKAWIRVSKSHIPHQISFQNEQNDPISPILKILNNIIGPQSLFSPPNIIPSIQHMIASRTYCSSFTNKQTELKIAPIPAYCDDIHEIFPHNAFLPNIHKSLQYTLNALYVICYCL